MAAGDVTSGTYPSSAHFVDKTSAAGFVPEIWSDEIIAAYEQNLVLANLVKKMSMRGKKGDVIHVPRPYRGSASAKAEATAVTIITDETDDLTININQHWEYSRFIEDIVDVQALSSLRQFYTSDAGYALAKQLDDYLFALGTGLGDGAGGAATSGANWVHSNTFNPNGAGGTLEAFVNNGVAASDTFTDASMRDGVQQLDDNDVPMTGRFMVIPPVLANTFRGIDRFNSSDFVSGRNVETGKIGDVYGVDIYVSTNVPNISQTGTNVRPALLGHKDAYVCAEQVGVRSQSEYKLEYLSTLFTADRLYGATVYRPENAINIMVLT